MTSWIRSLAVALVAGLVLVPVVGAQVPGRRMDREQLEQRVRERMAHMIQERLQLSDEEGSRLNQVMDELHDQRRQLRTEERALRQRLQGYVQAHEVDQDEARAIVMRMAELREEEAHLFRTEQERLLEILTPDQLLTLNRLRDQMSQRLRELRGQRPGRNGPPPGGSGRGPGGGPGFGLAPSGR
jgi:Spy/CpxP family protein refolding chaperone